MSPGFVHVSPAPVLVVDPDVVLDDVVVELELAPPALPFLLLHPAKAMHPPKAMTATSPVKT